MSTSSSSSSKPEPNAGARDQASRGEKETTSPKPPLTFKEAWPGLLIILGIGVIIAVVLWLSGATTGKALQVIAAPLAPPSPDAPAPPAPATPNVWGVAGTVLDDGRPVAEASVWAIASDAHGNQYVIGKKTTDKDGQFRLEPSPQSPVLPAPITEITVNAKLESWISSQREGQSILHVGAKAGGASKDDWSGPAFILPSVLILGGFGLSIVVAYLSRWPQLAWLYYVSVLLAFAFPVLMVGLVAGGETSLNNGRTNDDPIPLGFAYVYKGTFVPGLAEDQLISLTAPPSRKAPDAGKPLTSDADQAHPMPRADDHAAAGGPDKVDKVDKALAPRSAGGAASEDTRGFGAPLWVVLLAVVGSALFSISFIVEETLKPLPAGSEADRIQNIVRHQFFILFSPLGGVYLYQFLLLAGAASQPLTVGTAALASGLMLNLLLAKALKVVEGFFQKATDDRSKAREEQAQATEDRSEIVEVRRNGDEPAKKRTEPTPVDGPAQR